jgi:RNA-splicing ligase RtcB
MITINGKYNSAIVYAKAVEEKCEDQILLYLDHPMFADTQVRIMPDVHFGKGTTVGFTATCNEYVVPSIIGVDIGCGLLASPVQNAIDFARLDEEVRRSIPFASAVNSSVSFKELGAIYDRIKGREGSFDVFIDRVKSVAKKIGGSEERFIASIGSLGGGNHFISVNRRKNGEGYLIVHSGSRGFGKTVAEYHQEKAKRPVSRETIENGIEQIKKETANKREIGEKIKAYRERLNRQGKPRDMEWLELEDRKEYFEDMQLAQEYARLNRRIMIDRLVKALNLTALNEELVVESVHNYIDFSDGVIRKGAISARKDEACLIPLNMADGILLCKGKGNAEYNQSAPHGAGRALSRSQAKAQVSFEDFSKRMANSGVWTSCVSQATIDESPQAYKPADRIIKALDDTVEIVDRMAEIYNFKAS